MVCNTVWKIQIIFPTFGDFPTPKVHVFLFFPTPKPFEMPWCVVNAGNKIMIFRQKRFGVSIPHVRNMLRRVDLVDYGKIRDKTPWVLSDHDQL